MAVAPQDATDPRAGLEAFLAAHGLDGEPGTQTGGTGGRAAGRRRRRARPWPGVPDGAPTPVPAVPELVAVAVRPATARARRRSARVPARRRWAGGAASWTDAEHAAAVARVQEAIGRGDVYQANVVGHRSAPHRGDPQRWSRAVATLPGAATAGCWPGTGWAVGCASPEQLVRVVGDRVTTVPVKGTRR